MKCEVCLARLEEYFDGELPAADREQVSAHLMACGICAAEFESLSAEQELFARYDRNVEVPPFLWTRIAARMPVAHRRFFDLFSVRSFAGGVAIVLLAITIGLLYLTADNADQIGNDQRTDSGPKPASSPPAPKSERELLASKPKPRRRVKPAIKPAVKRDALDQSGVWSTELVFLDIDERDTARHIEQTEMLLRSMRNFPVSDSDEEIDVSYDTALSRRLLNENIVLRRDAEMKAKFPTKTLLADLEPFLLDIANLPDHARPEEVRAIKERVQKTEIVAALVGFQDGRLE